MVALAYVFLGVGCYLQLGMYLAGKTHWIAVVGLIWHCLIGIELYPDPPNRHDRAAATLLDSSPCG